MSGAKVRMMLLVALAAIARTAAAIEIDAAELSRCAAITPADQRVTCYDKLATAALSHANATTAAPSGPAAPAVAATQPPPPPVVNPNDPANFGLSQRQLKIDSQGPSTIKAVVSQMTEDRSNNVYLVLDNGQTWGFIEPDPRLRPGDSVTIKRASLGSFLMVTPSRHSYRVQRIK